MPFAFPETKADFTAPNGVTYVWADDAWRVKNYELNDSKLENYLPLSGGALTGNVRTDSLIKSTRTTGKAFEIKPNDQTPTGSWSSDGNLSITSSLTSDSAYVFSARAAGYEIEGVNNPAAFRVTAGGSVKAGHDKDNPFLASAQNDLVTKEFADTSYLPKTNPYVDGKITVVPTDWMQQSEFRNLKNTGAYFILKPSNDSDNCEIQYFGMQTSPWHLATLQYVQDYVSNHLGDAPIGGLSKLPGTACFNFTEERQLFSLRPGEISTFTAGGEQTSFLQDVRQIAFSGVDRDGNRHSPDLNAISTYQSWCGTAHLLNEPCTQTLLRIVGGSHLAGDYCVFQYNKDVDIYFLGWDKEETGVLTSEMVRLLPDQKITVRMPDWFI